MYVYIHVGQVLGRIRRIQLLILGIMNTILIIFILNPEAFLRKNITTSLKIQVLPRIGNFVFNIFILVHIHQGCIPGGGGCNKHHNLILLSIQEKCNTLLNIFKSWPLIWTTKNVPLQN